MIHYLFEFGLEKKCPKYCIVRHIIAYIFTFLRHCSIMSFLFASVPDAGAGWALLVGLWEIPARGGVLHVLVPREGVEECPDDPRRPHLPPELEQYAVRHECRVPHDRLFRLPFFLRQELAVLVQQCSTIGTPLLCEISGNTILVMVTFWSSSFASAVWFIVADITS